MPSFVTFDHHTLDYTDDIAKRCLASPSSPIAITLDQPGLFLQRR